MFVRICSVVILIFQFSSCNRGEGFDLHEEYNTSINQNQLKEIDIQVKTYDSVDLEVFKDSLIPWISIEQPEKQVQNLLNAEEIVLENIEATIIIDYPVRKNIEIDIKASSGKGFTRKELIMLISKEYQRIYKEDDETKGMYQKGDPEYNEISTNGKYGIWGHWISDLDLSRIIVEPGIKKPRLILYVES